MSLPPNLGPRNGILSLTIKDKSVLYAAYMPFIKNGGLFIPTNKVYKLGDEVFMLLNLMDEQEKIPVAGKVIWITPKGAQGNRAAGIGVQFGDLPGRCAQVGPSYPPHVTAAASCPPQATRSIAAHSSCGISLPPEAPHHVDRLPLSP